MMRPFAKLIAAVLTGMIALTALTGCRAAAQQIAANPADRNAELVAILNDSLKSPSAQGWAMQGVKEFQADANMNIAAQKAADILAKPIGRDEDGKDIETQEELTAALVKSGDHCIYYVSYAKNMDYSSDFFGLWKKYEMVQSLCENRISLNEWMGSGEEYVIAPNAAVLVGFADMTVNNENYLVTVMQIPTVPAA